MTNQNPNIVNDQDPFIPPVYMLILALVAFFIFVGVALTQPSVNVVGWGALGIAVLSFVAWIFMAPEQAKAFITGRTARFGGTTILVTIVFLAALVGIYTIISNQNWRVDLTQRDNFSLTDEARAKIASLGVDPNLPNVEILAFYGAGQAANRDRDSLLLEDYATTSGGKISYEFVDPDRNPAQATQYEVVRPGQLVVVKLNPDGQPDTENAELINFISQDELTNAILRVSAAGDFRAYFLTVDDGLELANISAIQSDLVDGLGWTMQEVSIFDLTGADSEINLNDPNVDGQVLVIPGGSTPLSDSEMAFISDYVNKGGDLVILAALNVNPDEPSLSTSENLSNYLYENFGVRFSNDVVLDANLSAGTPQVPVVSTFDPNNFITSRFAADQFFVVFELPLSIEVSPTLPTNVTVTELLISGDQSYAKTDIAAILNNEITQTDSDPKGPFVLGAAAENTATGSRVVLFSSPTIFTDLSGQRIVNNFIGEFSLIWATRFDEFFSQVNVISATKDQDTAVFADSQMLRNINLLTIFVLPFGVLGIGFLVWWSNRERTPRSPAPNQES